MGILRKFAVGTSFVAALALATGAMADGVARGSVKDAPAPRAISWTGLYAGGSVGYGWAEGTQALSDANFFGAAGASQTYNLDGVIGGGHLGYSHQFGQWVVGPEAGIMGGDLDQQLASPVPAFVNADTWRMQAKWLFTGTARLGYLFNPSSLIYVKAGYAGGIIDSEFTSCGVACGPAAPAIITSGTSAYHHGWTVGAGLEYALRSDIRLGLEYNYISLNAKDRDPGHLCVGACGGVQIPVGVRAEPGDIHAVTARLSFWLTR